MTGCAPRDMAGEKRYAGRGLGFVRFIIPRVNRAFGSSGTPTPTGRVRKRAGCRRIWRAEIRRPGGVWGSCVCIFRVGDDSNARLPTGKIKRYNAKHACRGGVPSPPGRISTARLTVLRPYCRGRRPRRPAVTVSAREKQTVNPQNNRPARRRRPLSRLRRQLPLRRGAFGAGRYVCATPWVRGGRTHIAIKNAPLGRFHLFPTPRPWGE